MELSTYNSTFSLKNKVLRLVWNIFALLFFKPFRLNLFKSYRRMVLNMFGAKIHTTANVYASVRIWAPWNLEIGEYSTLGPEVDCYNQGKITIGKNTIVSQKTYLCASSHDHKKPDFPLILCPIQIGDGVWVAADSFIGPGVRIGNNAVVGARAAVFRDLDPDKVYGGNPAKFIKNR
ncbi:MAG: putative colanic acid biosynthesis acetyltransferase [Flavobacteriaceae bacterium]|nr:putative colanic acid biosynthesis acetyltransferase [Flavobacteriaceae bacterium]